ncbi:hypothetical protein LMG28688_00556 [Paraburkholderia caffeinitolerans]|uniref:Uncharacterized protein n=1 Tax=Paraburkholderia caffeinitolerans TaxID=1723730 RepID=A0A6J5FHF0_9BURK|nr:MULTISPECIES: hypothetical protein [Paraburkholderia]CAB3778266.1 hypothetical protein LMG28688_00556 [Paraburkholderia caffeinitolerans]
MLSRKSKAIASPVIFLLSSLGLTSTGPNALVVIGGMCLSLAATLCLFANLIPGFGARYGRLIPTFSLLSNVPLTINGIFMVQGGMATGHTGLAVAGACLALSNAVFYGSANLRGFLGKISAKAHAHYSMVAGLLIAVAGAALFNPVLTFIGFGYVMEASLRKRPMPAPAEEMEPEIAA